MKRLVALSRRLSRRLGALVCGLRGHEFFYPSGCVNGWCAYSCIRCGELDQAIDDLPFAPIDDDQWDDGEARIACDRTQAARWIPFLPYPRWLS